MEQKYFCTVCGQEVILLDGVIERTCDHEDQPVVANMEAVAYGISNLE